MPSCWARRALSCHVRSLVPKRTRNTCNLPGTFGKEEQTPGIRHNRIVLSVQLLGQAGKPWSCLRLQISSVATCLASPVDAAAGALSDVKVITIIITLSPHSPRRGPTRHKRSGSGRRWGCLTTSPASSPYSPYPLADLPRRLSRQATRITYPGCLPTSSLKPNPLTHDHALLILSSRQQAAILLSLSPQAAALRQHQSEIPHLSRISSPIPPMQVILTPRRHSQGR